MLEQCDLDKLNEREIYYIKKYEAFGKGYNMTVGGDGVKGVGKIFDRKDVDNIIEELKRGVPVVDLAVKYNVNPESIYKINRGDTWYSEEESYPIRESQAEIIKKGIDKNKLVEEIATLGFKGAGKKYGLSGNGLKARCEMVGLPTKIEGIKELFGVTSIRIEVACKGRTLNIQAKDELVEYIIENNLTSTKRSHIISSINRVLRGERKSYLGITIKELRENNNI